MTVSSLSRADIVTLTDGTKLRGVLREVAPNEAVTIVLVDGSLHTVEWSAVARVERTIDPDVSWVHVDDGLGTRLETRGEGNAWVTVCRNGCDESLPRGAVYRIAGKGIRASIPFRIDSENANLAVHRATSQGFGGALALLIIGGALLVNGVTLVIEEAANRGSGRPPNDALLIGGGVTGGLSVPLLIGGAFLLRPNITTQVTITF
jgi:hypothetical protein